MAWETFEFYGMVVLGAIYVATWACLMIDMWRNSRD